MEQSLFEELTVVQLVKKYCPPPPPPSISLEPECSRPLSQELFTEPFHHFQGSSDAYIQFVSRNLLFKDGKEAGVWGVKLTSIEIRGGRWFKALIRPRNLVLRTRDGHRLLCKGEWTLWFRKWTGLALQIAERSKDIRWSRGSAFMWSV
jgi:hypothetical protein